MKKIVIFLFLLVVSLATGCASVDDIELSEKFYDVIISDDKQPIIYSWYDEADIDPTDSELLPESYQMKIRDLQTEVLDFLNKEFSIDWSAPEIKGYWTDVSKQLEGSNINYKAFYHDGKMYLDSEFFSADAFWEDEVSQYVLAHELIHFFYDMNSKKHGFWLENENGEVVGEYLEEAFVDELAFLYICYTGAEPQSFHSGYKYIRTAIDVLRISCPDIFKYFLENNIEGLQEYLNTMIAKRITVNGDAAEKVFFLIDCCQLNPTESNLSRLTTFLVEMTPKSNAEEFSNRFIFNIYEDYENYMR